MQRKLSPLHFVGIGGIGMAALAELFHAQGFSVSGSDLVAGPSFERLRGLGIRVTLGHEASALKEARTVVRSSAIPDENPELAAARTRELRIVSRGELLAEVMRTQDAIAIAGSHGKTTTSAMVAHLLDAAGLEPTALIGGRMPRPGGGSSPLKLGRGDLIVAEVDESDGSFLLTRPAFAVVTNVDPEHLDHYGNTHALHDAFVDFANALPFYGACALGVDHPGVAAITPRITSRKIGFGFHPDADVRAESVGPIPGGQRCHFALRDGRRGTFDLPMPGAHNVLNALAAIAMGLEQDVDIELLCEALAHFPGVARRFEDKGEAGGVRVVDDYAHHPAEVRAALAGAREVHSGPITAVFQPHRFSRTRDCWEEFRTAFDEADRVVIAEIYSAGENALPGIDSHRLAMALRETSHAEAHFGGTLDAIEADWADRFEAGELVLTLGAGDIVELGPRLLAALAARTGGQSR